MSLPQIFQFISFVYTDKKSAAPHVHIIILFISHTPTSSFTLMVLQTISFCIWPVAVKKKFKNTQLDFTNLNSNVTEVVGCNLYNTFFPIYIFTAYIPRNVSHVEFLSVFEYLESLYYSYEKSIPC